MLRFSSNIAWMFLVYTMYLVIIFQILLAKYCNRVIIHTVYRMYNIVAIIQITCNASVSPGVSCRSYHSDKRSIFQSGEGARRKVVALLTGKLNTTALVVGGTSKVNGGISTCEVALIIVRVISMCIMFALPMLTENILTMTILRFMNMYVLT